MTVPVHVSGASEVGSFETIDHLDRTGGIRYGTAELEMRDWLMIEDGISLCDHRGEVLLKYRGVSSGDLAVFITRIRFDPSSLEYVGATRGDYVSAWESFGANPSASATDEIIISGFLGENPIPTENSGDFELAILTFNCVECPSLSSLSLLDGVVVYADSPNQIMEVRLNDGTFICQEDLVTERSDINEDGRVDEQDILCILKDWKKLVILPSIPTPTTTNTPLPSELPDLVPGEMGIALETGDSCNYTSTTLGVWASVRNLGPGNAETFTVRVNNTDVAISGLSAGESEGFWVPGYNFDEQTTIVDVFNEVQEVSEANNHMTQFVPIPTLPPTCTRTPTPTGTPTNSATKEFLVSGVVAASTPCSGTQKGATVRLEPGGYETQTDSNSGSFSFGPIPEGEYTAWIEDRCNAFGCWPEQQVIVSGEDVSLLL